MRRTPAVHTALRPRRARAASQVRCRSIHRESAIRLPPGRISAIAPYQPSSRIGRARQTFQRLPLVAIKASVPGCTCHVGALSNPLSQLAREQGTFTQGLTVGTSGASNNRSSVDAAFHRKGAQGEGVEFGTAMRCAALLRLSRARPDFNYLSILERGKLPYKEVIGRAHWTPGSLRSLAHTYDAPRGGMYPEPIGRRTGCGEFKERTLRLRTEVEGTAQRIGRRYGRILE